MICFKHYSNCSPWSNP